MNNIKTTINPLTREAIKEALTRPDIKPMTRKDQIRMTALLCLFAEGERKAMEDLKNMGASENNLRMSQQNIVDALNIISEYGDMEVHNKFFNKLNEEKAKKRWGI
jgi:hypothetical protein